MTHHWRDVAINTQKLWSKILLANPIVGEGGTLGFLYIKRSKDSPLNLTIRDFIAAVGDDEPVLYQLEAIRCCLLEKYFDHPYRARALLGSLEYPYAPLLQSLDLTSHSGELDGQPPQGHLQARRPGACDRQLYEGLLRSPLPLESITYLHLLDIYPESRFSGDESRATLLRLAHLILLEAKSKIVKD